MTLEWVALMCFAAVLLYELVSRGRILRWVWREVMRFFIVMELWAIQWVRLIYPPRYVIVGQCQKRGDCCQAIVGDPPGWIKRSWLRRVFVVYHRTMHNFHEVASGPDQEVIFSCGYLKEDGRCGIYRYRPLLCRNYPVLPWFEPPQLMPGCGYRIASRAVAKMTSRPTLPILNPRVAVHHPTRTGGRQRYEQDEDYHMVDPS